MADKKKINRDAFLYLAPREDSYGKPEDFTKCRTCPLWMGEERKRCFILGKKLEVLGTDTCLYYSNGKPQTQLAGQEVEALTPEEAGFYKDLVQCKRCRYFNPLLSQCKLFFIAEMDFPDDIDLDGSKVNKNACCSFWRQKDSKEKDPILRYLGKEYSLKDLFTTKGDVNEEYEKAKKKAEKGAKLNDKESYPSHILPKDVKSESVKDTGLSKEAFVWLHNWSWSKKFWLDEKGRYKIPTISKDIEKELSKHKPSETVTLYRGTKDSCVNEENKTLKSYSYQQQYAEAVANIGEYSDPETEGGRVIMEDISPDRILVDMTKIPNYDKYFTNEVIVKAK